MKKLTIETNEGQFDIPVKWIGEALAVHRPVIGFGGKLSKDKCRWTITHIESGKTAGIYSGPMHEAIKLAKTWDLIFKEDLPGPNPDTKRWVLTAQWCEQVKRHKPISTPDRFQAVIESYTQS